MMVRLELKEPYLLATFAGRVSLSEVIEDFKKTCDAAAKRGFDKILVDCLAVEGELSTLERYELGRTVAEYCQRRSMNPKIATVGYPPLINGFGALVASNRGLVAETFSEFQKVVEWLNRFGSKAAARGTG